MNGFYHQDERDDAAGYGFLSLMLMLLAIIVAVLLSVLL